MSYNFQPNTLFTQQLVKRIERLTKGKKGVCATCGIMKDSITEFKMWNESGEVRYESKYYEIGSITKTITGLLMSNAVISGMASEKDRISKWIPELDQEKYWPTIERLLTHTSGFPADDKSMFEEYEIEESNPLTWTRQELIHQISEYTLEDRVYEPVYSNIGCATIGLVLEKIYGMSYKELVYDFCDEYGLRNMIVYPNGELGLSGIGKDGRKCENWRWSESNTFAPAGSIAATPEDMMMYGNIILNQKEAAIRTATKPIKQYSGEGVNPVIKIGYFWLSLPEYNIYFHNGGSGCFNTAIAIDMETRTIMTFLCNCYLEEDALFIISELYRLRNYDLMPRIAS